MLFERELYGEAEMEAFGEILSSAFNEGGVVYLEGDLGMGKTTLVRGILHGLGHQGPVKSPTYTLVEPYELNGIEAFHFDLYRVGHPEELEYMGVRDYFSDKSLCLVEWPAMGQGVLPDADCLINICRVSQGRKVVLEARTEVGLVALKAMQSAIEL